MAETIPIPPAARAWIATGHTDMHRAMNPLAPLVWCRKPSNATRMAAASIRWQSSKPINILHDRLGMSFYPASRPLSLACTG
ncbi:hypothetical protein [Bradyrhizobium sp. 25ACV]